MNNEKGTSVFGGPEHKITESGNVFVNNFVVKAGSVNCFKQPKVAGHFIVDAHKTESGYFVGIECVDDQEQSADYVISMTASGDNCEPNSVLITANNLAEQEVKPTYKELEAECLMLKEQIAEVFERRQELRDEVAKLENERDALAAQVEQLTEEVFKLQYFDIDVIRCLKTIAFEHNHSDIALYQELAKKCMSDIASRKPLAEIRAEAVLQFAGTVLAKYRYDITEWAKIEANKIRQGGAK